MKGYKRIWKVINSLWKRWWKFMDDVMKRLWEVMKGYEYPQNIFRISSEYPQNILRISSEYPQNILRLSLRLSSDYLISSEYPLKMLIWHNMSWWNIINQKRHKIGEKIQHDSPFFFRYQGYRSLRALAIKKIMLTYKCSVTLAEITLFCGFLFRSYEVWVRQINNWSFL